MIGNKKNDLSGLSPEFETNPYEVLDDIFFNPEKEYIIHVEDDYLKQAIWQFLKDNNLEERTKDFSHEYIFISFDLGTFNCIEKPNYKDKRIYDIPYDWTELMNLLKSYLSENPFEKKQVVQKDQESWSSPREDFKVDKKSPLYETMIIEVNTDGSENAPIVFTNIDEIKAVLIERNWDDSHFKEWNGDEDDECISLVDDIDDIDFGDYDVDNCDASDENPHIIISCDHTQNADVTLLLEIYRPFKKYIDSEYGATTYIEFDNDVIYQLTPYTPSEPNSFDKIGNILDDLDFDTNTKNRFNSLNELADELIV